MTALPVRVGHDRVARDRVPGDSLRLDRVGARDRDDRVDLVGVEDRPLERLHAAERSARDGGEPLDPELVEKCALRPHHVGDRDDGEVRPVRLAARRIDRRRAGRPATPTEQVRGDDEVAIGVERLAGADHAVPPAEPLAGGTVTIFVAEPVAGALLGRRLRETGRMRIAAQRVADKDHVVAVPATAFRRSRRQPGSDGARARSRAGAAREGRGTASRPCPPTRRWAWALRLPPPR